MIWVCQNNDVYYFEDKLVLFDVLEIETVRIYNLSEQKVFIKKEIIRNNKSVYKK